MMNFLSSVWAKVSPYLTKVYSWSPFVTGLLLGYFGKPLISFVLGILGKVL